MSERDDRVDGLLLDVLAACWDEGCPVRGDEAMAAVARRRWASQSRRLRKGAPRDQRVEDLAKGLRDHVEKDPRLAQMTEYRFLAERLANVLDPVL